MYSKLKKIYMRKWIMLRYYDLSGRWISWLWCSRFCFHLQYCFITGLLPLVLFLLAVKHRSCFLGLRFYWKDYYIHTTLVLQVNYRSFVFRYTPNFGHFVSSLPIVTFWTCFDGLESSAHLFVFCVKLWVIVWSGLGSCLSLSHLCLPFRRLNQEVLQKILGKKKILKLFWFLSVILMPNSITPVYKNIC